MRPKKEDPMQQFTPEGRIDAYLKQDLDMSRVREGSERLSQEESKRLARAQVLKSQGVMRGQRWDSFKDRVKRNYYWRLKMLRFGGLKRFTFETLPLLVFATFAVVVAWKMEDKLDQMKRRVIRTKTFREEESERENKMITGALSGEQRYDDVPIPIKGDNLWKYRIDRGEESEDERLVASPYEEYKKSDLSAEEMAEMMKQYEDHASRLMGGNKQMPSPGYSKNAEVNRKNIKRHKPQN
jgi:hypothetical protein